MAVSGNHVVPRALSKTHGKKNCVGLYPGSWTPGPPQQGEDQQEAHRPYPQAGSSPCSGCSQTRVGVCVFNTLNSFPTIHMSNYFSKHQLLPGLQFLKSRRISAKPAEDGAKLTRYATGRSVLLSCGSICLGKAGPGCTPVLLEPHSWGSTASTGSGPDTLVSGERNNDVFLKYWCLQVEQCGASLWTEGMHRS